MQLKCSMKCPKEKLQEKKYIFFFVYVCVCVPLDSVFHVLAESSAGMEFAESDGFSEEWPAHASWWDVEASL